MEIRQLEYFVTVCELRNFTGAADKLHVSQPAVTKAIRNLEDELGLQLFDRNQRRVLLTEEGAALLSSVQDILARLGALRNLVNEYRSLTRGSFRIAVPPMIGAYVFPPLFAAFKAQYPRLDMLVIEVGSYSAVNLVKKGKAHVGLATLPPDLAGLNVWPVRTEEVLVCLPGGHPLAARHRLTFAELKDEPVILHNKGFALRPLVLREYAERGLEPNVVFSTNQFQTIKALVAKGAGISFLTKISVGDASNIAGVPMDPPLFLNIGLVWRPQTLLPLACEAFIDFVRQGQGPGDEKS